ncbi:hypothetical protein [Nocardia sp. NPDC052316]|uniref:hypothetical protein n=1 Tax=Nocardia sp. NPDC052316 TaxID=3364329 RepID=UPI0037C7D0FB
MPDSEPPGPRGGDRPLELPADTAPSAVAAARPAAVERPAGPPAEVEAVVARWNPQGVALLRAVRGTGAAGAVTLIGPADANTTLLRTELARFEPRIELTDPVTDASTAVETTSPSGTAPSPVALILLDAGTTLGADLLRIVHRLRSDGTRILLAMNAIHAYQDWRSVRARDLELLAAQGVADLDIVPVSARLAAAARTAGDAGLLDRSGLGALHAALAAAATGAEAEGGDRLAAVTARVLADTRQRVFEQVTALQSGAETARLREERAIMLAGRDGGRATAMSTLRGQLHLARVDLMTEVGARIRALHTATRADLDRMRRSELGGYPERLQHATTELTGALDLAIDQRLAELTAHIDSSVGPGLLGTGPGLLGAAPTQSMPSRRRDPAPRVGPDPDPRHRGVEDHLVIALGASAGVGLGRLLVSPLSLVPALDFASVPVTLLLGAGVAGWVVRARGQLADRAHVRQWVSDALINVKAQLEQRIATALVETETVLADRVVQLSAARMVETDRRVAEVEARLRRMVAEQPGQLAACERDITILDRWIAAG